MASSHKMGTGMIPKIMPSPNMVKKGILGRELTGLPPVLTIAMPRKTIMVARVPMNECIPVLVINSPFKYPRKSARP